MERTENDDGKIQTLFGVDPFRGEFDQHLCSACCTCVVPCPPLHLARLGERTQGTTGAKRESRHPLWVPLDAYRAGNCNDVHAWPTQYLAQEVHLLIALVLSG